MTHHPKSIVAAAALALCAATSSAPAALVVVEVHRDILRSARELEPLGVNEFGDIGGTKAAAGNLLYDSGFEPIRLRALYRVAETGVEQGRSWMRLDGPGTSQWLLYTDGTFSGARIRGYRFVDAEGRVPYRDQAGGGRILDEAAAVRCIPLPPARVLPAGSPGLPRGGWCAPAPKTFDDWERAPEIERENYRRQWRVWYEGDVTYQLDDVVVFEREWFWPDPSDFHPRTSADGIHLTWELKGPGSVRIVPHTADVPPEMNGGRGCVQIIPAGGRAVLWYKLAGGVQRADRFWYGTLDEGTTYRYEAWVKGERGTITLTFGELDPARATEGYFGQPIARSFPLEPRWTRVGFEFVAPPPGPDGIWGATLLVEGASTVLVDNVKLQPVYQPGDEDRPFVIHRPLFQTLLDAQPPTGRKGAARVWFGLNSAAMTSLLDWYCESDLELGTSLGVQAATPLTLPRALMILEATGSSPEDRMVPWLMGQVTHTEQEYRQLIEYLAAPYDPGVDTPSAKPMAYVRFRQRGHGRPWTDEFREIILEFGNENWHNRAMPKWIGMGRYGAVHQHGRAMGLWIAHMVAEMRKSPWWQPEKFRVVVGGNYSAGVRTDGTVSGYGQEAVVAAGGAIDDHSHATYVGPRWEMGEASQTTVNDLGFQKTLLAYRGGHLTEWEQQQRAHERLRELGFRVRMSAYEGGPSGFGLRANSPEEDRAGEIYGKSLAMGTAVFDAWLDAWRLGWTHQCYLSFGQGKWWSSHTSRSDGHRPSPGWLALKLINHHLANLDMLKVDVQGAPTLEAEPKSRGRRTQDRGRLEVPAITAHAFGDGRRFAVALANLHLSEPQTVEIRVPVAAAARIEWHYLAGDPRQTNLEALNITLQSRTLDAGLLRDGRLEQTLPPGSAGVLVVDAALPRG